MQTNSITALSNTDLLREIKTHAADLRRREVDLLRLLIELDDRRLYLEQGYSSLFTYMTRALAFSEGCAYKRISAARAAKKHPEILADLESGKLNFSTVAILAPKLTAENVTELTTKAQGLPKRKVEELFGTPKEIVREKDTIRHVTTPAAAAAAPAAAQNLTLPGDSATIEQRVEIKFFASKDLVRKLERAREVLSHKYPAGRFEDVLGDAIDLLLAKKDLSAAAPRTPRAPAATNPRARFFAKSIARELDREAGGQCTFESADGVRCTERRFLENDHVMPWALGGATSRENGRRMCKAHNGMKGRKSFGH